MKVSSDWNAIIPEGTSPNDVAALLKTYLQMLPEPLLTYAVYDEVKEARGNARQLSDILRTIPYAHYSTLECLLALLLRISQKSALNKVRQIQHLHFMFFNLCVYVN